MTRSSAVSRLQADLAADHRKVQAEKARLVRAEVNDKYWRQQAYRQGNKNQILSAAQEARAGAVSKIASESMWVKEAATLASYLERWQAEDRAELCYRALFRSKGNDGQRLSMTLADLEGGIFDQMRKAIYRERNSDWQIAGHMQKVFSAAKADCRHAARLQRHVVEHRALVARHLEVAVERQGPQDR